MSTFLAELNEYCVSYRYFFYQLGSQLTVQSALVGLLRPFELEIT